MKYLMLVMTEPVADPVPEDMDIEAWVQAFDSSGERFFGDRLAPAVDAVTVRVRAAGETVGPGPAHSAHGAIAGLDILECDSLERAVEIAKAHPMAREGVIQVWPFYDWGDEG